MLQYGTGQGGASVWQLQCPVRTQYAGARLANNLALSAHCLEMSFTDSLLYSTGLWTCGYKCVCVPGCVCVGLAQCVCEAFALLAFMIGSVSATQSSVFSIKLSLCVSQPITHSFPLSPFHYLYLSPSLSLPFLPPFLPQCLINSSNFGHNNAYYIPIAYKRLPSPRTPFPIRFLLILTP